MQQKRRYDKHGKLIPFWKPILELPSDKFSKDFVDKGETFKKQMGAFRTVPRSHQESITKKNAFNDEFIGSEKYYPRFSQVEASVAK